MTNLLDSNPYVVVIVFDFNSKAFDTVWHASWTFSPINIVSTASVVPAPSASQFSRELEDIRVAEALVSMREGPNTTHKSHTSDTIPETQDLDIDREVVLPNVSVAIWRNSWSQCDCFVRRPCTPRLGLIRLSLGFRQLELNIFHLYLVNLHTLSWMGSHTNTTGHFTLFYDVNLIGWRSWIRDRENRSWRVVSFPKLHYSDTTRLVADLSPTDPRIVGSKSETTPRQVCDKSETSP